RVVAQVFDSFTDKTTTITSTDQMSPGRPVLPALSYDITLACSPGCTPPEPRGVRLLDATTLPELSAFAPHVTTTVTDPVRLTGANAITREEPGMTAQNVWVPDIPYTYQRLSVISGTEPISSDRLLISPTQFSASDATHGRLRQFETMVFEVSYVRPDPQVLGCGWFQRVCNWFSGKSRVSKKKKTTLASQAIMPNQLEETLVLSSVLTLGRNIAPDYVDVSATYTVDGIHWQKTMLSPEATQPSGETTIVTFTADIAAPTWPSPAFAAFFEFKDKAGNVLVGTPRGAEFYQLFMPLARQDVPPDLVGSIGVVPDKRAFAAGEPVELRATISNASAGDAGPFWVDLFVNPSAPPTAANVTWNNACGMDPCFGLSWKVDGLAAGQSITLSSTNLPPGYSVWPGWFAAGTTDLYLSVDSWKPGVAQGAVAEANEANNIAHLGGLSVKGVNPPFLRMRPAAELPARPAP
ncbi:MAG TPA: hypothetical protein VFX76_20085, partial [Roseiflexaceae bacterium]|nr:hypothetical protein [Roseiflexaceae bacterium]